MEEREGTRLVGQRRLEVSTTTSPPPATPSSPVSDLPAPVSPDPFPAPPVASNQGLLERQARWFRERSKFDRKLPDDEGSK